MIKYFLGMSLGIVLFNAQYSFAKQQDSTIFLGDTIHISPDVFKNYDIQKRQLFKVVDTKNSKYLVSNVGNFTLGDRKFSVADPLNDGVTKILVIGNSFSDDGVESYLHDMARSTGKPMVIGNLFRGGAPLDFHLKNATTNNKIYSYRKTTIDGIKSNTNKTSILEALKDDNWDYICFQQASVTSGNWESIEESLPKLYNYVAENYPISTVKYLYHQTWAYAENAVTANFDAYNRDQTYMFNQIVNVSKRIGELIPLYKIIPSGTAIQNGRTSFLGDNFTREGYHLDLAFGRYTAASTWYESLFSNINDVKYIPSHISEYQVNLAKEAAASAVKRPFEVTSLDNFNKQKIQYKSFDKIQINFGSDFIIAGWLSLLFEREGSARYDILDNNNKETNVNISVIQNFESRKANGPKLTSFNSGIPSHVSQYYFKAEIDKASANKPFLRLENLNPNKKYSITVISTINDKLENMAVYINGAKTSTEVINPSFNKQKELLFKEIKPTADGRFDIGFSLLEGQMKASGVINALIIKEL